MESNKIIICPEITEKGEQSYGQLPLMCGAIVPKSSTYRKMWVHLHYSRTEMILTLYHEIQHILYPAASEGLIELLEKLYGGLAIDAYPKK